MAGVKNRTKFTKYLATMLVEFTGKQISVGKNTSAADRVTAAHQQKVRARLERALTLIIQLVFSGVGLDAFDTERGQWRIPSSMMILPDYEASVDLLKAPFVYLEADTKAGFFFIAREGFPPVAVTPSLTFVEKTVAAQIERAHNPLTPTVTDVGRKAQLPGSKASDKTAAAKAGDTTSSDASADDEPGMDADKPPTVTDQTFACEQFAKAVIMAEKWANHDGMRNAKRADIGQSAFNAITVLRTLQDRIIHAEERADNKLAA
jgi:hypothetical protein